MTSLQLDAYILGTAFIAWGLAVIFSLRWFAWRRLAIEANQLASEMLNELEEARRKRSASARHARQCQLQQQRAKVLAKAAEMRGEANG